MKKCPCGIIQTVKICSRFYHTPWWAGQIALLIICTLSSLDLWKPCRVTVNFIFLRSTCNKSRFCKIWVWAKRLQYTLAASQMLTYGILCSWPWYITLVTIVTFTIEKICMNYDSTIENPCALTGYICGSITNCQLTKESMLHSYQNLQL